MYVSDTQQGIGSNAQRRAAMQRLFAAEPGAGCSSQKILTVGPTPNCRRLLGVAREQTPNRPSPMWELAEELSPARMPEVRPRPACKELHPSVLMIVNNSSRSALAGDGVIICEAQEAEELRKDEEYCP